MFIRPEYLKPALAAAALLIVGATSYQSGRQHAENRYRAQVSELRQTHAEALLKAERHYTAALQKHAEQYQARLQAAREADKNLSATIRQIHSEAETRKKEIPHVIQKDPADCGVLGTFGLQHYRQSLGY